MPFGCRLSTARGAIDRHAMGEKAMHLSRKDTSFAKMAADRNCRPSRDKGVFKVPIFAALILLLASGVASQTQTVEIVAVGDILLSRGLESKIGKFGADYPFANVSGTLSGADLAFGNLENPLTGKCKKAEKRYQFQADPSSAKILSNAGFDVLSLANNHSLDCGDVGLFQTIQNLTDNNLQAIGVAENTANIQSPVYFEKKGIKIGFLAFTAIRPDLKRSVYPNLAIADPKLIARSIAETRKHAAVVVVSFHWGTEYASRPNTEQIELANIAVEAGADVILGHHPHVLQGFSVFQNEGSKRRSFIAYSLGNFVFDSPKSLIAKTAESVILKIRVGENGFVSAEAIPVLIENYRPEIAAGNSKELILKRLNRQSENWEQ